MREHSSPTSIMSHFQSDIPQSPEETGTLQKVSTRVQFYHNSLQQYKILINGMRTEFLFTGRGDQERLPKDIDIKRQDFTHRSI